MPRLIDATIGILAMSFRLLIKKPLAIAIAAALLPSLANANSQRDENTAKMDAVLVVGERIQRDQQETNTSVRIFDQEDLANLNAFDVTDLLNKTANITADNTSFTIRGIDNQGVTRNEGGSDSGTIFVDNIPMPSNSINSSTLNTWDIATVEVLRGAQSTNQGANTQAGAIIIRTNEPEFVNSGQARLRVGNYNTYEAAIAQGGAVVDNVLAYRLALQHKSSDGYTTNPILNDDKWDSSKELNGRMKLLWQPTGEKDTQVLLTLARQENERPANQNVFTVTPTDGSDTPAQEDIFKREAYMNTPWEVKQDLSQQAVVEFDHQLNTQWKLQTISTLMAYDFHSTYDEDRNNERDAFRDSYSSSDVWSHEIRMNFSGDKLYAVAGLYASYTSKDNNNNTIGRATRFAPGFPPAIYDYDTTYQQSNTNFALYLDSDYKLTDALTVNAGLRIDQTETDYNTSGETRRTNDFSGLGGDAFCAGEAPTYGSNATTCNDLIDEVLSVTDGYGKGDNKDIAVLPKIGILAKLNDNINLGYNIQRAFRSAGTSLNTGTGEVIEYDAEFSTNHEVSFRSQWFEQALTVNANAFYVDWSDQQVQVSDSNNPYDAYIDNAGKSTLKGAELEVFWQINANLDSYLSLGLVDTEFTEFPNNNGTDLKGNEFAKAADTTASFGINWDSNIHWFAGINGRYTSDSYMAIENTDKTDAYTVFDSQAGYQTADWKVSAYVKNLTDKEYVLYQRIDEETDATYTGYKVGAPRTLGMIAELYW